MPERPKSLQEHWDYFETTIQHRIEQFTGKQLDIEDIERLKAAWCDGAVSAAELMGRHGVSGDEIKGQLLSMIATGAGDARQRATAAQAKRN